MSDADDAYKEAQRLIAEVKASGDNTLNLNTTETHALAKLPPEIADLTGITTLFLINDRITDLTPIAGMTGIRELWLDNARIADLRPLLSLTKIAENPEYSCLSFKNTPATKLDPNLAELSEIRDAKTRTTKTIAYLREVGDNWPPIPTTTPDQDTILTITQTEDGRLDISPATPDADELSDTVKRKAHQLLQQSPPTAATSLQIARTNRG